MKNLLLTIAMSWAVIGMSQSTTWYQITSGTNNQLNVVDFPSNMVGYIGGNDSLLLKTTNGGLTWNQVSHSGVSFFSGGEHIVNLEFTSENTGYMTVGPYGGTYKTTDGGLNWTQLTFVGNMCYNQALFFWDEDNGVVGGSGCFQGEYVEVMTGGTLASATINSPSWDASDIILDIDFYDNQYGLGVSKERILKTTDGGVNWDTIPHGNTDIELTSIKIIADTLAYAGYIDLSSNFGLLKSNDSGQTWTTETSMATFYYPDYHDITETNNGYIYSVGGEDSQGDGLIFEDVGQGWWFYPIDHTLRSVDSYNDSTVFAVGDSGYVVTNIDPALLSFTDEQLDSPELKLYPNPTNSELNITIAEEDLTSITSLFVYDMLGNEVIMYNKYVDKLDVSNLSVGEYILRITTQTEVITEKFVVQ